MRVSSATYDIYSFTMTCLRRAAGQPPPDKQASKRERERDQVDTPRQRGRYSTSEEWLHRSPRQLSKYSPPLLSKDAFQGTQRERVPITCKGDAKIAQTGAANDIPKLNLTT